MFPHMRRFILACVLCALAFPGIARGTDPPPHDVTLASPAVVVFGHPVNVTGTVSPADPDLPVTIEQLSGGAWNPVATPTTDATGAFVASFSAAGGGHLRARLDDGGLSPERGLKVLPAVSFKFGHARAFLGVHVAGNVQPASFPRRVHITVRAAGRVLARTSAGVFSGKISKRIPTPWAGRVRIRIAFPAAAGLAARTISRRIWVAARTLRVGLQGADVRALHLRLAQLKVHVPGTGKVFSVRTFDSVVAFQKARGLSRTGVVDTSTWRALGLVHTFHPRYARPTPHIEVDKGRQILMIVRRGKVTGIIPVSTGATGNTPVGAWSILWKAPATSTWLGSATLYRTMTFHGNVAIHGYYSVPTYPASHGCVRVPIWEADWLYNQSPVGERVYVYE
jgi:L,D-transpeptidase catalytic domain/Putative peptidoglycan binding domain